MTEAPRFFRACGKVRPSRTALLPPLRVASTSFSFSIPLQSFAAGYTSLCGIGYIQLHACPLLLSMDFTLSSLHLCVTNKYAIKHSRTLLLFSLFRLSLSLLSSSSLSLSSHFLFYIACSYDHSLSSPLPMASAHLLLSAAACGFRPTYIY